MTLKNAVFIQFFIFTKIRQGDKDNKHVEIFEGNFLNVILFSTQYLFQRGTYSIGA